ncbi:MAG: Hpt domain-containing protein [Luteitalea sp.]
MDVRMNTPPVDPEVLEMLETLQEPGEPDILVELLTLFLRDTPERLRELTVEPLPVPTAARVAHTVKGSAGNIGASRLQQLAGDLEHACRPHRQDEARAALPTLVAALSAEYARVAQHLQLVIVARGGGAASSTH